MRRKYARVHVVFSVPRRNYPVFEQLLFLIEEKTGAKVMKQWEE